MTQFQLTWLPAEAFRRLAQIGMTSYTAAFLPMLCLQLSAGVARAQGNDCASCLNIASLVELSTSGGPIVPSTTQYVIRIANGPWLVSHLYMKPPQIAIYDEAGRFLQLYERSGAGPGEFRMAPLLFAGSAGTVWAFDNERVVILDATLRHVETRNLRRRRVASDAVILANGRFVVDRAFDYEPGAPEARFQVTLLDSAGSVRRRVEPRSDEHTVVAPAHGDGFWTLRSNQLLLRRYSNDGELIRSIPIVTEHFQPWEERLTEGGGGVAVPPPPWHQSMLDVGDGQMVLLTWVAGPEWTPRPANQGFRPSEIDHSRLFDTIVALVDLRTGRAIASKRLPEALLIVGGTSDLVYSTRRDTDGHVITSIWRLQTRHP